MRILIFTGNDCLSRGLVSAATGIYCTEWDHPSLILSAVPGHLESLFGIKPGPEPIQISDQLWGWEINIDHLLSKYWPHGWSYLRRVGAWINRDPRDFLDSLGIECISGLGHLAELKEYSVIAYDSGLGLRDLARSIKSLEDFDWGMERYYKPIRFALPLFRPALIIAGLAGFPFPDESVFRELEAAQARAKAALRLIKDPQIVGIRHVISEWTPSLKELDHARKYSLECLILDEAHSATGFGFEARIQPIPLKLLRCNTRTTKDLRKLAVQIYGPMDPSLKPR